MTRTATDIAGILKAINEYDPAWDGGKMVITPNDPARTDVKLYPSTSSDVKSWSGAA